ncbi:MAG TPA: type II toxin-antitoxin system Phd/YefM family antitoxin [Polyangiaceae bacterium]|nr:type II toxin-antitoxin system Phd/YefM family antitoxin [Polyangiaceae bacterium]
MPKRYSIAEARANLPLVVNEAVSGVGVELTRRGKPIVVVLSVEQYEKLRGKHLVFGTAYRNFLKKHPLKEVGVDANLCKTVRDRGTGRPVKL